MIVAGVPQSYNRCAYIQEMCIARDADTSVRYSSRPCNAVGFIRNIASNMQAVCIATHVKTHIVSPVTFGVIV